jgi:DNA invertase Pin-like site-specific DNA recombinase
MMGGGLPAAATGFVSDKIQRRHRERAAIVYVRQSTVQQIERHQESTRLQYALADRAFHFGWGRGSITVIDDDLGRSGASIEGRLGFQRLVAEVGVGRVGLVLGVEMSRLARSCRDWHQLLEICALFDTLIADADGVYDPGNDNDRLLLGLKGTMSEAELHILKARMLEGKRAKARRGELGKTVPMGYVRRPSGEVAFGPENRLVARTLERQWEEALAERSRLEGEHERFRREQPRALDPAEVVAIQDLARDVPAVWHAGSREDRQTIARLLLERVLVEVIDGSEQVDVECHWHGGNRTCHRLVRPVARLDRLSTYRALTQRASELHRVGRDFAAIADTLNAEG